MMSVNPESLLQKKRLIICWYTFALLVVTLHGVNAACPVINEFNFGRILGQVPPKSLIDESMKHVEWLSGTWRSIEGYAIYEHIDNVNFTEEMEYQPFDMAPLYIHKSQAYVKDIKSHHQLGYLSVDPFNTTNVAKVIAHIQGITEISEGSVANPKSLILKSQSIGNMSFMLFTDVKKLERHLKLDEDGILESKIFMETVLHPTMKLHIYARYRKDQRTF